jgi:hypothetical protein
LAWRLLLLAAANERRQFALAAAWLVMCLKQA